MKRKGLEDFFEEAMVFVNNEVPLKCPEVEYTSYNNLPADVQLAAQINYYRKLRRPKDVVELGFELDLSNIPENFLQRDIRVTTAQLVHARHLIFATPKQLDYLSKAVTWYCDGTFSIVKDPFLQMFSVHVFIRHGTCFKQIPVAFVIMSRRTKEDYEQVFKALLQLLPQVHVKKVVIDFEKAVWSTLRRMMSRNEFPNVKIKGCFFHFTQALYRRIGLIGLAAQYKHCLGTRDICRQMMALAFLPKEYVPKQFKRLKERCIMTGIENLKKFAIYMEKNWINGWFTPEDWVRFREFVRTNNHTEGWHRGLNSRFKKKNIHFYLLIKGLHREATSAHRDALQVYQGKKTTPMSSANKARNEFLDNQWEQLQRREVPPQVFLEKVSRKVQPRENQINSRIDLDPHDFEDMDFDDMM